jgi:hypothetical protein
MASINRASINRRGQVAASPILNGIDFVQVVNTAQTILVVHFLNRVTVAGTLKAAPTISGGDTIASVAVLPIATSDWGLDQNHVTLTLHVEAPGDFSTYTLTLASPMLDNFFASAAFSFKALCPADIDCETPAPAVSPGAASLPPIDYMAKDFLSFRQALLDFSALQYPGWQERSEADLGVVLLEAMAAVADDLSYTQDRVAAEATLTTATQRRSVVRHARLIDYEPAPALSAQTFLQFDVAPGTTQIQYGVRAVAQAEDGSPIVFETGPSLGERFVTGAGLLKRPGGVPASALWNAGPAAGPAGGLGAIPAYWFDDSTQSLPAGATSMYVLGHGYKFQPNQLLLIETTIGAGQAPLRQVVQLLDQGAPQGAWASELCDPVITRAADPPGSGPPWFACVPSPPETSPPSAVTRIMWISADQLLVARDQSVTTVSGNLVPASQGLTVVDETFAVQPALGVPQIPTPTIVRTGPRQTNPDGSIGTAMPQHLHTLAAGTVAWLPATPDADPVDAYPQPEIALMDDTGQGWTWSRRLLDAGAVAHSANPRGWLRAIRLRWRQWRYVAVWRRQFRADPGGRHRLYGHLPRRRRSRRQCRGRRHRADRCRAAGRRRIVRGAQPVAGDRRRGPGDARPCAPDRPHGVHPAAPARRHYAGLRGYRGVASVGAARPDHVSVDRKLADRVHYARSGRRRGDCAGSAGVTRRIARSLPHGGI